MFWPGPLPLAHGALGPLDEILPILVVGLFILVFAAPTIIALARRSRRGGAQGESQAAAPDAPAAPDEAQPAALDPANAARRDHYRLD